MNKMSQIFPKLEALYNTIINDYIKIYSEKVIKNIKPSKKKSHKSKKKKDNININLDTLKSYCMSHNEDNKKYSALTSFTLEYLNIISEFLKKDTKNNFEAKYLDIYCLAYISLVGFDCFFTDLQTEDELFLFKPEKYLYFSEFIKNNLNVKDLKEYYETNSKNISKNFNNDKSLYSYLIIQFDVDNQFQSQFIDEKQKPNEEASTIENKNSKNNQIIPDSTKKDDSNMTQKISEKKNSLNMDLEEDKNKNEKSKYNIKIDEDNNEINIINNLTEKNDLNDKSQKQNNDETQISKKNEKDTKELDFNKIEISTNDVTDIKDKKDDERFYHLELQLNLSEIRLLYNDIKIKFQLFGESTFNSAIINTLKNENKYLQICTQSLKNIVTNLSNPYNFNFWRKLSNIILKNIFIILKRSKFTIHQNKDISILEQLKSMVNKKRFNKQIKTSIDERIKKYEEELKKTKENRTDTENPSADKKRSFNLITLNKDGKVDINASLTIDFLFYLKEEGNKFNHFDESILNYILFDDIIIIEEDEMIKDKDKSELFEEDDIKNIKKGKKINEKQEKNINIIENKQVNQANESIKIDEKTEKSKGKIVTINQPKNNTIIVNEEIKDSGIIIDDGKIIIENKQANELIKIDQIKEKTEEKTVNINEQKNKITKAHQELKDSITKVNDIKNSDTKIIIENEQTNESIKIEEKKEKTKEKITNINEPKNNSIIVNKEPKDDITKSNLIENNDVKIHESKKNDTKVNEIKKIVDNKTKNSPPDIKTENDNEKINENNNNICKEKKYIKINETKINISNEIKNTSTKVNEPTNINSKIEEKKEKIIAKNDKEFKTNEPIKVSNKEKNSINENEENKTNGNTYKNKAKNDDEIYNLKIDYQGKKIFSGTELIKIFKNPAKYQRKELKLKNLFNSIYKKIDDLKRELEFKSSNINVIDLIQETKDLESEAKELKEKMEMEIKRLSNIDFKNMEKININEIKDSNLKKLLNNYSLLKNVYNEIGQKIKFYEDKKIKFIELDNLIINSENEINNNINIIQLKIKEAAELIQISNVFEKYKFDLINNKMKKDEYKKNSIKN